MAIETTAVPRDCTKCGQAIHGDIYSVGGGDFHLWCVPKVDWPSTEAIKREAWQNGYKAGFADGVAGKG